MPLPAAQGLVVLSFATIPAALDRLAEIVDDRPGRRRDARPDDPRPGRGRTRSTPHHLDFTEGRPAAVLAAQFYADSPAELADRADELARKFEGRPGVLGVRKRLVDAAKDDFWKVRKAGFSLLMGMVGDAKPIAFVEDTAVDPAGCRSSTTGSARSSNGTASTAACYGHADVGCLHIRPMINVKTETASRRCGRSPREVSDLVVEFGGAMSGEHGDGLARSLWNRKLFGPEVYEAFEAVKRRVRPRKPAQPRQGVGDADPGGQPPDRARLPPARASSDGPSTSQTRGGSRGPSRCARAWAPAARPASGTMCPSYMVTRDEMHTTRGRANLLRLAMTGELPAADDGFDNETLHEALDLCLQCKACKSECPSQVDMAKLKAEVLHQHYQNRAAAARPPPAGPDLPLEPDRSRHRPAGESRRCATRRSNGCSRRPPASTAAGRCPRSPGRISASGSAAIRRIARPATAGASSCSTTASRPTTIRRSASRPCGCWRPRAIGSSWRAWRAADGRRSPRGSLPLAPRAGRRQRCRSSLPSLAQGIPILGCEPSCLVTLVDEYRDFRLGPDAEAVARHASWSTRSSPIRERVPDLPLETNSRPRAGSRPLPAEGRPRDGGHAGGAAADPGARCPRARFGLLRHGRLVRLRARPLRSERGTGESRADPGSARRPDARLVAPGFSCRSQVHGLAGIDALHPIQVLAEQLA